MEVQVAFWLGLKHNGSAKNRKLKKKFGHTDENIYGTWDKSDE